MNNLISLIRDFCPNGVDHIKLSTISKRLNEKNGELKYNSVRAVVSSGKLVDPLMIFKDSVASEDKSNYLVVRKNHYIYNPARINIGSIAYSQEEEPVILSPMYIVFDLDKEKVLNEYFDYFIRSSEGRRQIISRVEEGARFRFPYESMEKLFIPLPPLAIQKEIVQILDQFKQLITELTTEHTARKQQYDYYLNKMYEDLSKNKASLVKLHEIGIIERGNGLQKSDFVEKGVPCIHYGQIYTYFGTYTAKTKSFVSIELAKKLKKVKYGDIIIAVTSENIEDVCKSVLWLGDEEIVTGGHTGIFRHNQNPKYIAYFFKTKMFFEQKRKIAHGTKVIEVTPRKLENIVIPIPSLDEQQRIVDILDKFDKLVNDISEGLPAEIAARKKQYEYYRDKLLTFKEVGNESI